MVNYFKLIFFTKKMLQNEIITFFTLCQNLTKCKSLQVFFYIRNRMND